MSDDSQKPREASHKPCRRCCEPIPLAAKRCPRCQSWQSLWAYLAGNPQGWLGLPFCLLALLPLYWLWGRSGADFAKYRDQVEVLEARMQVSHERGYDGLVTLGRLRNNSPVKWEDVVIEVQYFDKEGKLVGTKSEKDHSLVLLPGGEHAFQVNASLTLPAESYASQKVFVRDAREARRWP
jgi:hypothetical protein